MNTKGTWRALSVAISIGACCTASHAATHNVQVTWNLGGTSTFVSSSNTLLAVSTPDVDVLDVFGNLKVGSASVDSETGVLRAFAGVQRGGIAQAGLSVTGGSDLVTSFTSSFSETIHINGAGAYVPIDIYMLVQGEVFTSGQGTGTVHDVGSAQARFNLQLNGVSSQQARLTLSADAGNAKSFTTFGDVTSASIYGGLLHVTGQVKNGMDVTIAGSAAAHVEAPALSFAQAVADIAHTAYIKIELGGGYGWEAGKSGFLSAPAFPETSPIPEPAIWGLMLLGLATTGAASRRQRRGA